MNRRAFLGTLGVFSILPGAGRVWKAVRPPPLKLVPYWYQYHRVAYTPWPRDVFRQLLTQAGIPEYVPKIDGPGESERIAALYRSEFERLSL